MSPSWRSQALGILREFFRSTRTALGSPEQRDAIAALYPWRDMTQQRARQAVWDEAVRDTIADRQKLAAWEALNQ